jgi:hypothetical protein
MSFPATTASETIAFGLLAPFYTLFPQIVIRNFAGSLDTDIRRTT